MNHWTLHYNHFVSEQEGLREALCTLGNGYFATRGAGSEATADDVHYPGTYLAGGYNRLVTEIAGRAIENEDLVNLPNWLCLRFRINSGDWFALRAVAIEYFSQTLNLKEGNLSREVHFKDAHGHRCQLKEQRLVHMERSHLAAIEWQLMAENWSGHIEIQSGLDGSVLNTGVERYHSLNSTHLEILEQGYADPHTSWLKVRTSQSDLRVAQAARTQIWIDNEVVAAPSKQQAEPPYIQQQYSLEVKQGSQIRLEKVVALYTSRDFATTECGLEAREAVIAAPNFAELQREQRLSWAMLWEQFDIEIHLKSRVRGLHPLLILRLHIFHLIQTASPNTVDLDVGVPARGWHGEAYRGHIFWDELFIFPLLNLRMPKITSALLRYRIRRLPQARHAAQLAGFSGALYPWQSGSNGREESQQVHLNPRSERWIPDHSSLQRHVNGAIVYNLWEHYQVTRDIDFLISYGAETILEVARFFASLATYNEQHERYEILGVMGPDEYHDGYPNCDQPGIDNNAYTNVLAVWVLCRAREVLRLMPQVHADELCRRLQINATELEQWEAISRRMRIVFHHGNIISQFEGYEQLNEFPWEIYRKKYRDIHRLDRILESEGDSANRYQLSKQADVLMLFYLFSIEELSALFARLGYLFDPTMLQKNVDYYSERTAHGSTLSRVVHSWVLARADRQGSWQLLLDALQSDVADTQGGTTAEGIHLGAMAGTVDIVQRGYAGIRMRQDVLWFHPCLPDAVGKLCFVVHYRGHTMNVTLTVGRLVLAVKEGAALPIRVGCGDEVFELSAGSHKEIELT